MVSPQNNLENAVNENQSATQILGALTSQVGKALGNATDNIVENGINEISNRAKRLSEENTLGAAANLQAISQNTLLDSNLRANNPSQESENVEGAQDKETDSNSTPINNFANKHKAPFMGMMGSIINLAFSKFVSFMVAGFSKVVEFFKSIFKGIVGLFVSPSTDRDTVTSERQENQASTSNPDQAQPRRSHSLSRDNTATTNQPRMRRNNSAPNFMEGLMSNLTTNVVSELGGVANGIGPMMGGMAQQYVNENPDQTKDMITELTRANARTLVTGVSQGLAKAAHEKVASVSSDVGNVLADKATDLVGIGVDKVGGLIQGGINWLTGENKQPVPQTVQPQAEQPQVEQPQVTTTPKESTGWGQWLWNGVKSGAQAIYNNMPATESVVGTNNDTFAHTEVNTTSEENASPIRTENKNIPKDEDDDENDIFFDCSDEDDDEYESESSLSFN